MSDKIPDKHIISIGQKLTVPAWQRPMVAAPDFNPGMEQLYTVKRGDSLWTIAVAFYNDGAKQDIIYQANASRLRNPHDIFEGQKLVIPKR